MLKVLYKDGCKPCQRLKNALSKLNITHKTIHMNTEEGMKLIKILRGTTDNPTVPAVFKNGFYMGDSNISLVNIAEVIDV